MNTREIRRLEMFRRVRDFGATYAEAFAAGSLARELFDDLDTVLNELEEAGAAELAASGVARQGTTGKGIARVQLYETLRVIGRTARAMAFSTPGMEEKFRLPNKNNAQELLNAARAFLVEATRLKDEFIKHEMPPDFLERLARNIEALEQAMLGQSAGKEARISARATIDATVERGMDAVRRLTPIILNKFRDDPPMLAIWESARHTERTSRHRHGRNNNNTPAPPAQ